MERRQFGRTDMWVSPLGFGGSEIGFGGVEVGVVGQILGTALDAGLNVVDTGECYADSEEKIGAAIGHRRSDYWLFTKCGHSSGFDLPDWDPCLLRQSIDRSLTRLRTDRLDLIQLHSCGIELLQKGDVIEVLRLAREAGKVRYIGYSGDGEAAKYAIECGAFDSLQTSVNVADQEAVSLTLPLAERAGIGVIAKRPIANAAWIAEPPMGAYARPYWERLQELQYELTPETALRFTLSQYVHVAIVGTSKPERWTENFTYATKGRLSTSELNRLRERWAEVASPQWVGLT